MSRNLLTPALHTILCAASLTLSLAAQTPATQSSGTQSSTAQDPAKDPGPSSAQQTPYVLHAYTDLLQIPTLVLDLYGAPLGRLDTRSFQLRIDAGPPFHPTALHTEGVEPLSLAIVLDASGAQSELIKALPGTPGHGIPVTLLPDDVLSVYAFDCRILRSAADVPTSNPALPGSVERVLATPRLHNAGGRTCPDGKHLWEALGIAATDLSRQPGRRAILVISDGQDYGSRTKWEDLREFSADRSIAIFGLRDTTNLRGTSFSAPFSIGAHSAPEDLFAELAGRTGGIVLPSEKKELGGQLEHVIALLRSRYILQFPRPAQMGGGEHHLDVHVTDRNASVHSAGITVPVRDPALWNDPTTVPTDTSKLPVAGKRKPLKP